VLKQFSSDLAFNPLSSVCNQVAATVHYRLGGFKKVKPKINIKKLTIQNLKREIA
jgi:hypothetical protein